MVAMVIMATQANNDGSNIKWSFEVVLESDCSLIFGCFLGTSAWGVSFNKVEATVSPAVFKHRFCVGVSFWISDYLGAAAFEGIFEWLFFTLIYDYIYIIIHFWSFFVYMFEAVIMATYEHYYKCLVWLFWWSRDFLHWFSRFVIIN